MMADKPWKQFERDMGKLIGGTRFWANSGESVDVIGPVFLGQCKHVKNMSLNAIAELASEVAEEGRTRKAVVSGSVAEQGVYAPAPSSRIASDPRLGIVCLRTRPGRGKKSKTIIVMDESVFRELFPTGGKDGHN